LIQTQGPDVYSDYELLAEHELNELIARRDPQAQRYTDLADRYPLATSANNARIYAADLYQESGHAMASLRQLQTVYLSTDSLERLSMTAGRVALMYLQQDRTDLAKSWLRRVNREHPDLVLTRDDQPVSISSWLSELTSLLSLVRVLPRIDLPLSTPKLIPGRPMPARSPGAAPPRDRVLMRDDQSFWMLSAPGLHETWRRPLPASDARILVTDDRQVIWWSQDTGLLGGMDSRTGEQLWPDIDFASALQDAGSSNRRLDLRTPQQMPFVQILGGFGVRNPRPNPATATQGARLSAIDPSTVILADRLGRIVCIDRHTGKIRWRTVSSSDNLTALTISDGLVAISGANWAGTQVQHGIVTLLDILTGEPLPMQIQPEQVPTWLGFADTGLLVMAGNSKLMAYDTATGRTQWVHELQRQAVVRRVWIGTNLLIASTYQAQVGSALIINTNTGKVINQIAIRSTTGQANAFDASQTPQQWHAFTPAQALALDPAGRTLWSDAICAPVGHILTQLVGEQFLGIISNTGTQPVPILPPLNANGRPELEQAIQRMVDAGQLRIKQGGYRLYLLDRTSGRILTEYPLPNLPGPIDPAATVFLDDALLLAVGDQTLLIQSQTTPD
jgi:outer membrane protein assembly factor BamB